MRFREWKTCQPWLQSIIYLPFHELDLNDVFAFLCSGCGKILYGFTFIFIEIHLVSNKSETFFRGNFSNVLQSEICPNHIWRQGFNLYTINLHEPIRPYRSDNKTNFPSSYFRLSIPRYLKIVDMYIGISINLLSF